MLNNSFTYKKSLLLSVTFLFFNLLSLTKYGTLAEDFRLPALFQKEKALTVDNLMHVFS